MANDPRYRSSRPDRLSQDRPSGYPLSELARLIGQDDAAAATAIAIERGAAGVYNIVDDEPAPVREWLPALAAMLGAKPPRRLPKWLARIAAGEHIVMLMTATRAGSNAKAKRELCWEPAHPSWRQGFAEILSQAQGGAAGGPGEKAGM